MKLVTYLKLIRGYVVVIVADPGGGAVLGVGVVSLDLKFVLR